MVGTATPACAWGSPVRTAISLAPPRPARRTSSRVLADGLLVRALAALNTVNCVAHLSVKPACSGVGRPSIAERDHATVQTTRSAGSEDRLHDQPAVRDERHEEAQQAAQDHGREGKLEAF